MPGYKLVFLQEILKTFLCAYCKLVMRDPVQTSKTGIRFCKECYNKAPRYALSKLYCPVMYYFGSCSKHLRIYAGYIIYVLARIIYAQFCSYHNKVYRDHR